MFPFMEEFGSPSFNGISNPVRKKRTQTSRRPRPDSQPVAEDRDDSPLFSTPPSDDVSKVSSDDNGSGNTNSKRKEINLNQFVSRVHSAAEADSENFYEKNKKDGGFNSFYNNEPRRSGFKKKRSSEGVLAPANWKCKMKDGFDSESRSLDANGGRNGESLNLGQGGIPLDRLGNKNKVKKVKLKVGGVKRTIQANTTSNGAVRGESSTKSSRSVDASRMRPRHKFQGNSDDNHSSIDKRSRLQGIPWKDFSRGGYSLGKEECLMGKLSGKSTSCKQGDKFELVRKSKRVPKRRVLDGEFGSEEDDEIRYLEKLRTSKNTGYKEDEELSKKHRKLSRVSNVENVGSSRSGKDGKRSKSDIASEDTDYEEDEESRSDGEFEGKKMKKQKKESVDSLMVNKREMTLTMRQWALQSSKDSAPGTSVIEFPNGLPPAPSRKPKEKPSELEQQLKKAEAAQRRRMQVDKAARESEAEAIRKILGQESSRKKREDKFKKRQEELAQERAANAMMLPSNTVRLVMGPTGTVLKFSEDMGLPSIFDSKPHSYPPPREKCASTSCTNPYKYRDSKSKVPFCSLQCYKAIQQTMLAETTC
ncbi:hypothetical protein ACB094_10G069000 [Castanea mollissima]